MARLVALIGWSLRRGTDPAPAASHTAYAGTGMSTTQPPPVIGLERITRLRDRLPDVMLRDRRRLERRVAELTRGTDPHRARAALARAEADVDRAVARTLQRRAAVPLVHYPPELPVSTAREEIAAAIAANQVVVVAGETGSGKTTQLPKICLDLGRGVTGMIGHTQPRRIAARSVAERVAEELGTELGGTVGYTVRFTDQVGEDTLVKMMTDGILLAEVQRDRDLLGYDTIIVDEAHERSLNIDFLLGYLKGLLPRRPDLKLIITSATIDPYRFAEHFGGAPVVEVSGRTYPVEVRYRPLLEENPEEDAEDDEPRDQVRAVCDAVLELADEGPGDVLVFLSGEREIRDTADALRGLVTATRSLRGTEILPLYARLSAAEQHRVFAPHPGRRVVLATNVAETSLTVPGVRYVVDPGTARISRYSLRTKVQRLPIERVSQASARQRAGRCGRVADGICIRLYSEEDHDSRPEYTDPEVLRTNLASVILQMTALGLGDVAAFPFVDPPDRRAVKDGVDLLLELGALQAPEQGVQRLTPLGRRLAQLPLDPRLARMILAADEQGCTREVMVIAAALSIQDPRERPAEHQQAADEKHARFRDPTSDFLAYLNLWNHVREQQRELSSSAFRRMCRSEFLNYLRIREWQDLVAQLRQLARTVGVTLAPEQHGGGSAVDPQHVHTALLAGLLSHIGVKEGDRNEYLGARGARFAVFPGSALFKKPPAWVMAAELVETSRLWGRDCARIDPAWVEPLAPHLVKRTYGEPHWEARRGSVVATEKVTLYGVPIVAGRTVQYGRIDPELSRELFVRHALVEGDWRTPHRFFAENRELLEDVEELENRVRRRGLVVDDETLFAFYDARIPADVVSGRHFDAWWKVARRSDPDLLTFPRDLLVPDGIGDLDADYPPVWRQGDLELPLTYQFEPGSAADGVTVQVPLVVLNRLDPAAFGWQVPGLREELVTELVRSLPKALRRLLVPAPDRAREVLLRTGAARGPAPEEPLLAVLARELTAAAGTEVRPEDFDLARVPPHLTVTHRVVRPDGAVLAEGKDLTEIRRRLRPTQRAVMARAADRLERAALTGWPSHLPGGALPRTFAGDAHGAGEAAGADHRLVGYPALVEEAGTPPTVALRVLPTAAEQDRAMPAGTRRLLLQRIPSPAKGVLGRLPTPTKLALAAAPHTTASALFDDCLAATVDALVAELGGPAWDASAFERLEVAVRGRLETEVTDVVSRVATVLSAAADVDRRLRASSSLVLLPALTDVRAQVSALVHPGFVTASGRHRLPDVLRYLRAAARRLETLPEHPERDRRLMWQVELVQESYRQELERLPAGAPVPAGLAEVRWMIEELRVSFFAQQLGTPYPVSEKRIRKALTTPT